MLIVITIYYCYQLKITENITIYLVWSGSQIFYFLNSTQITWTVLECVCLLEWCVARTLINKTNKRLGFHNLSTKFWFYNADNLRYSSRCESLNASVNFYFPTSLRSKVYLQQKKYIIKLALRKGTSRSGKSSQFSFHLKFYTKKKKICFNSRTPNWFSALIL